MQLRVVSLLLERNVDANIGDQEKLYKNSQKYAFFKDAMHNFKNNLYVLLLILCMNREL